MSDVHHPVPTRSKLYSPLVFVVLVILVGILGHAAFSAYQKRNISASARQSVANEVSDLEARQASMQESITRLRSPDGIDTEIREKFQVVKPGEEMIVVVPEAKKNQ